MNANKWIFGTNVATYRVGNPKYPTNSWLYTLPTSILFFAFALIFNWAWWLQLSLTVGAGLLVGQLRWAWWRHKHPIKSGEDYVRDMIDAAPWN